jgi:hypothetical protein
MCDEAGELMFLLPSVCCGRGDPRPLAGRTRTADCEQALLTAEFSGATAIFAAASAPIGLSLIRRPTTSAPHTLASNVFVLVPPPLPCRHSFLPALTDQHSRQPDGPENEHPISTPKEQSVQAKKNGRDPDPPVGKGVFEQRKNGFEQPNGVGQEDTTKHDAKSNFNDEQRVSSWMGGSLSHS